MRNVPNFELCQKYILSQSFKMFARLGLGRPKSSSGSAMDLLHNADIHFTSVTFCFLK